MLAYPATAITRSSYAADQMRLLQTNYAPDLVIGLSIWACQSPEPRRVRLSPLDDRAMEPDYPQFDPSMLNNERGAAILVFDLDGTILDCNSFPAWVLFLAYGPIHGLPVPTRVLLSLRVHRLLLRRRMGRSTRHAFVRGLRDCWLRTGGDIRAASRFHLAMQARVRPCLRPALAFVAAGADAVLATAAAAEYAEHLGALLGFRHILATEPEPGLLGRLNAGQVKCDRVFTLLRSLGWDRRRIIFFTDHPDDLPLMMRSSVVCWFGTPVALGRVRARAKHADIIDCSGYTAEAMAGLLARLGIVVEAPATAAS